MSDEVKAATEPAWKTDPVFAHIPITEEGVARWRARKRILDQTRRQDWAELRQRLGLKPR